MPLPCRKWNGIQAGFTESESGFRFVNKMQFLYWIHIRIHQVSESRFFNRISPKIKNVIPHEECRQNAPIHWAGRWTNHWSLAWPVRCQTHDYLPRRRASLQHWSVPIHKCFVTKRLHVCKQLAQADSETAGRSWTHDICDRLGSFTLILNTKRFNINFITPMNRTHRT